MTTTNDTPTRGVLVDEAKTLRSQLEAKQRHLAHADQELCRAQEANRDLQRHLETSHAEIVMLEHRIAERPICPECETLLPALMRTEALCERRLAVIVDLERALEAAKERVESAERALVIERSRPVWWRKLLG